MLRRITDMPGKTSFLLVEHSSEASQNYKGLLPGGDKYLTAPEGLRDDCFTC